MRSEVWCQLSGPLPAIEAQVLLLKTKYISSVKLTICPIPRSTGQRAPQQALNCSLPALQAPDFGIGPPLYDRELTSPRLRNIAVIRPACSPYSEGLFVQLCLSPGQLDRLRQHSVLAELLPHASWVGQGHEEQRVAACNSP